MSLSLKFCLLLKFIKHFMLASWQSWHSLYKSITSNSIELCTVNAAYHNYKRFSMICYPGFPAEYSSKWCSTKFTIQRHLWLNTRGYTLCYCLLKYLRFRNPIKTYLPVQTRGHMVRTSIHLFMSKTFAVNCLFGCEVNICCHVKTCLYEIKFALTGYKIRFQIAKTRRGNLLYFE